MKWPFVRRRELETLHLKLDSLKKEISEYQVSSKKQKDEIDRLKKLKKNLESKIKELSSPFTKDPSYLTPFRLDNVMISSIPASYVIFKKGAYYFAQPCRHGLERFFGRNASSVIQSAINFLSNGEKIFIKRGDYNLSENIELDATKNIWLEGEGHTTIAEWDEGATRLVFSGTFGITTINPPLDETNRVYISNLFIYTGKIGINLINWDVVILKNLLICSWGYDNTDSIGLKIVGPSPAKAELADITCQNLETGFRFEFDHLTGVNLKASEVKTGFYLENTNHHTTLINPQAEDVYQDGFRLRGSRTVLVNPQVETVQSGADGFHIDSPANFFNYLINPHYVDMQAGSKYINYISGKLKILDMQEISGTLTENSGTAIITAGNTYVDVSHGLLMTPELERISLTPQTDLEGRDIWVSNATSTTFRINISSVDTKDNVIGWRYN